MIIKKALIALAYLSLTSGTVSGCAWLKSEGKTVETAAIDCAKAEADIATKGVSVIQAAVDVGVEVASLAAGGGAGAIAGLEPLVEKYGEPLVACVLKDIADGTPTAPTAAPSTSELSPQAVVAAGVIQSRGWTYTK